MKTALEALALVHELNESTIDKTGKTGTLTFISTGFVSEVRFGDEIVWDEFEHAAPYLEDDQMPLRQWFAQRIIEIMEEKGLASKIMVSAANSPAVTPES